MRPEQFALEVEVDDVNGLAASKSSSLGRFEVGSLIVLIPAFLLISARASNPIFVHNF